MPANDSSEAFLRTFNERFDVFQKKFQNLFVVLTENNHATKVEAAEDLAKSLDDLKRILSEPDRPRWILELEQSLAPLLRNRSHQPLVGELVQRLAAISYDIKSQNWAYLRESGINPVDFDAIYRSYYERSKIPQLFDEMIRKLQEIVDSGLVDSVRATRLLEKLIATLKRNKSGSYFSTINTKHFAIRFIRHSLVDFGKQIPIVGSMIAGAEKTLEEMESEFDKLEGEMRPAIEAQIIPDLPALEQQRRQNAALPAPGTEAPTS